MSSFWTFWYTKMKTASFFLLPSLRSGCDWLCPALLNAVMLTQSIQDLTQIYGQTGISRDLSVNFVPLCWWFTDRRLFLEHLSVKPGPKRLNFYGQIAIFDHFVRNRHFSIKPFTDRRPIFIDMSVNGSDFSKYSAHSVSTPSHQSKLPIRFASGYFHHGRQLSCIRKKQDDLQFETWFFQHLRLYQLHIKPSFL